MSIYKQLVIRVHERKQREEAEACQRKQMRRETFLKAVEEVTGQSRDQWPEPEWVETTYNSPYWSVIVDGEIQFMQHKSGALFVVLQPSVCSDGCQAVIKMPEDLEGLVRRHLDYGEKHRP